MGTQDNDIVRGAVVTEATLESVRGSSVHRSFTLMLMAGALGLVSGSITEIYRGRYSVVVFYTVVYLVTLAIARARSLHYRARAGVTILVFYLIAVSELWYYGLASMATAFSVLLSIYATMYFPKRVAIGCILGTTATSIAFAGAYVGGLVPVVTPQQQPALNWLSWLGVIGPQTFMCFMVYLLLADYAASLQQTFGELHAEAERRSRAQEALLESEARYRALFEAADFGILLMRGGELVDCNPHLALMAGATREEILRLGGKTFTLGKQPNGQITSEHVRQIDRATVELGPQSFQLRFRRLDGAEMDVEGMAISIHIMGKRHLLVMVRDITERLRAAAEQERLREELAQSHRLESIGRLAGGIAHDFNNMLAVISGLAETALHELPGENPARHFFNDIQQASDRSAALTRQLLAFARKQSATPQVIDVNTAIDGALGMLRRLIGEHIELRWVPGEAPWPVYIDPAQLDRVLTNLVVNARDAVLQVEPRGGVISVSTHNASLEELNEQDGPRHAPGDYVVVCISDSGAGMTREVMDHIFEPFFTTKSFGQGTGLGLATVYGIVKQNGGFITVHSEQAQGTVFKIYLPRTSEAAPASRPEPPAAPSKAAGHGQVTVLVVEDEPEILRLATRMLERNGYQVLATSSPNEAVALASQHAGEIQLLLTDVIMPEMHGRILRDKVLEIHPGVQTLFMSGYTADVIAQHGVLEKGVHFIEKPFAYKNLFAKIDEILA